jgi:hypothetical protein
MVNAIAIMILIVIATRIYKISKNGGITNLRTEVLYAGTHFVFAFVAFAVFMAIASI